MKVTNHVFAKKMNFHGGKMLRTVYVYLIAGKNGSVLLDTGVSPNAGEVLKFIETCGKTPKDVNKIVITHAHTDHIGALKMLKEQLNATVAASVKSSRWIENVQLQKEERPVPNFDQFVGGSTKVEEKLTPGDTIFLGGSTLKVYEASGHEPGQLAFYHEEDSVLFTGDAVPVPKEMPVYEDLYAEVATLHRLMEIPDVKILLMSWKEPCIGEEQVKKALEDGLNYVRRIHGLVSEGIALYSEKDFDAVAKYVHSALELPAETLNPLFLGTIAAHMREKDLVI